MSHFSHDRKLNAIWHVIFVILITNYISWISCHRSNGKQVPCPWLCDGNEGRNVFLLRELLINLGDTGRF